MKAWEYIKSDFDAAMDNDPALSRDLKGALEIIFCTQGFLAITCHRGIHFLHSTMHIPVLPRFLSLIVRWWTGIEIHPGARIGKRFFIDHGSGVVIGETAEVGDNVTMYQGVTLGGTGKDVGKRHPTIGSGVTIGAGAKVLGPITIGDHSKVGAGAIVLKDVPPECTVVGNPGRIVKKKQPETGVDLDQIHLPDPMLDRMESLYLRLTHMEKCLARHAKRLGCTEADGAPSGGDDDGRCSGDCSKCPDALPEIKEDPYADL